MPLTRQQSTINERLAKYCAEQKIDINRWEPMECDVTLDMECINKLLQLDVEEMIVDEQTGKKYHDKAQCVCGARVKKIAHLIPIWNPSHDKTKYALLGINCFNIWFKGASPEVQKKCNAVRRRVARNVCRKKITLTCVACDKPNSNSHVSYASDEFIHHHVGCMPVQMLYDFEDKYEHQQHIYRTTFKCGVCGQCDMLANQNFHKSHHSDFLKACRYKFKSGQYAGRTMWDVFIENPMFVIAGMNITTLPKHYRQMITTLVNHAGDGWICDKQQMP
jgi:hypothetical protein